MIGTSPRLTDPDHSATRSFRNPIIQRPEIPKSMITKEKCKMKNASKVARLLIIAVMTAILISALGVTTSARVDEEITRYVGVEYPLPVNTRENDYGLPGNYLGFSDPSMVLVDGKPAPEGNFFVYPKGGTMKFIKAGKLKMLHQWQYYDGTVAGNDNPIYRGYIHYIVTVKEKEAISGDIKVTYDEPFVAGKPFPEPSTP